uniref:Abhydrolase domain-containing protein C22H12.03 n=1 Tax=Schistocephalus solidus TaxID=70667 RepID=A0A0V0J3P1_SCHSO
MNDKPCALNRSSPVHLYRLDETEFLRARCQKHGCVWFIATPQTTLQCGMCSNLRITDEAYAIALTGSLTYPVIRLFSLTQRNASYHSIAYQHNVGNRPFADKVIWETKFHCCLSPLHQDG